MQFRIEATTPTLPRDMRTVLEAVRDKWLSSTPQETDEEIQLLDTLFLGSHNEARGKVTLMRNAAIAANNARSLDRTHTEVLALINRGIDGVCASLDMKSLVPLRVSIFGFYKSVAKDGVYRRLSIGIDDAMHEAEDTEPEARAVPMLPPAAASDQFANLRSYTGSRYGT
jgi:hypothetical protein